MFQAGLVLEGGGMKGVYTAGVLDFFLDKGIDLRYEAYTNQLFPILHDEQLEELEKKYIVLRQESVGEHHRVVRICTNWATDVKVIDQMIEDIKMYVREKD